MADTSGFIVLLEKDISNEALERTLNAIGLFKNVLVVAPVSDDIAVQIAEFRVRRDISKKLFDVLYRNKEGK